MADQPTDQPPTFCVDGWMVGALVDCLFAHQASDCWTGIINYLPTNQPTNQPLSGWMGGWVVRCFNANGEPTNQPPTHFLYGWVGGWCVGRLLSCHQAGGCWVGINKLYKVSATFFSLNGEPTNQSTNQLTNRPIFSMDGWVGFALF